MDDDSMDSIVVDTVDVQSFHGISVLFKKYGQSKVSLFDSDEVWTFSL
jgi:hypothetical protein